MSYLKNNKVKDFVIAQIKEKLYDFEGISEYGCDFSYKLFEGENYDGVYFYSTYESKQWIQKYFDDLDEIVEELTFEFGADYISKFNPFSEPDKFVLIIIIEVAAYLLGQCKTIEDNWNNEFVLSKSKIKKIINELSNL